MPPEEVRQTCAFECTFVELYICRFYHDMKGRSQKIAHVIFFSKARLLWLRPLTIKSHDKYAMNSEGDAHLSDLL